MDDSTSSSAPVAPAAAPISAIVDGMSEKPAVNGIHDEQKEPEQAEVQPASFVPANGNVPAYSENATLPPIATVTPLKPQFDAALSEPSPAQTSPSDDAAMDARPAVSENLPLDQPKHSHPTPPPDQPYLAPPATNDAVISEQAFAEIPVIKPPVQTTVTEPSVAVVVETAPKPETMVIQSTPLATDRLLNAVEQSGSPLTSAAPPDPAEIATPTVATDSQQASSLVRPREDDPEEDEPAAKRSRVGDEQISTPAAVASPAPVAPTPMQVAEPVAQPESAPATDAPNTTAATSTTAIEAPSELKTDIAMPDAPLSSIEPATPADAPATVLSADPITPSTTAPGTSTTSQYYTTPMTDLQKSFLLEKTKNLKKTKHATAFLMPVDAVKLNIPNYPNIVKNPMDLGSLENKLKTDQYRSAQEYADDFNLIVSNSRLFNGDAHVVTIAAFNMEAYFKKYMSTLPGPQEIAQPKAAKRASPVAPRPQPRREARLPPPPPPAPVSPAVSSAQTFALQADGTPQIRRDSTTKRPHRTIKPPQNRELAYAKPKRKEHQLELKFCEHVLEEVRSPKYGRLNHLFQTPVDPVALNIPQYRQIIKKPMDLTTMGQKLKSGQYATASEFRTDFELMINNCLIFNPPGNPVRDIGVEFRREFDSLWEDKAKWERINKKTSERASSASDESEEESEEEEEEDATRAAQQATIAALTKQLAELQKTVAAASQWGDKKKKKDGKKKEKKHSVGGTTVKVKAAAKPKAPKKIKPLSYDEKQEISNAVGKMNEAQVGKLTQIITDNCEKYRNMGDDMELEIDDLPNDVQAMLLKHVRSIFGNPNRGARVASPDDLAAEDDDDYVGTARGGGAGGKRKKHKPMGKKEQQENIAELRKSLAAFNNPNSESGSPTSASYNAAQGLPANDTSGDEESEESEEE